jgi:hypothetical protein
MARVLQQIEHTGERLARSRASWGDHGKGFTCKAPEGFDGLT